MVHKLAHRILCFFGQHYGGVASNEYGLWFQCHWCNHTSGFTGYSFLKGEQHVEQ